MPRAQNQIQIVDTHETSETLAVTRLQRVGHQINRTLLIPDDAALVDAIALIVPDEVGRQALLVDNPQRLFRFNG
ncbi:hypothetical protein [Limnohabitans sp. Rim8]|uniref:hypothetical protein n=1 Tax=Limnohabitans sp. Rim8 TaxID=1100718 RepID=UPI0025FB3422|nr:hypothetical protein [Limnohabitans sp. Rim8]